jgi:hypothetical protein
MKSRPDEKQVSPFSAAGDDLGQLRRLLKESLRAYGEKIEAEIERVRAALAEEGTKKKPDTSRLRDARDIATLIRNLELKPEKGRRRDLKKIEALVEDISQLVSGW